MNESPLQFVKEQKWKYKITGKEIEVGCPFDECPNQGEPQFYINIETGKWICHRCDQKGNNLRSLAFKLGLITLQEPVKSKHIYIPDKDLQKYQAQLKSNKHALTYLRETRGLKDSTLHQFKLGFKEVDGHPAIVIPDFDATGTCVGLKYHFYTRPEGVTSKYRKEAGSKTQFFNLHRIDFNQPLIVTEGEYDAISLWQFGYENVGSIPNGANGLNGWIEEINPAKEILICFDNDPAGNEGAEKLGERLGLSKCKRVYPRLKDANDYLQLGLGKKDIDFIFEHAESMFTAPVTQLVQYVDGARQIIDDPEKAKGISTGWTNVDFLLGGIRPGEVTISSGLTGHGKTTFAVSLIGNLMEQDIKCLIVSPEMREYYLLLELANNFHQRRVKNHKELDEFIAHASDKVHIARVFDMWTNKTKGSLLDRVFDVIEYAIRNNGIKFILLDHLRLFLSVGQQDQERFAIDEFMQRCVRTAIAHGVHIWLIVQPKNLPAQQKKVTMHDLKGSSTISQDAHNILLIHREQDKKKENLVHVDVVKNREFGTTGTAVLEFNLNSRANYSE